MAFQSIIKGLPIPEAHLPESFKLLVRQLNGLGLAIIPLKKSKIVEEAPLDVLPDPVLASAEIPASEPIEGESAIDEKDEKSKAEEPENIKFE